MNFMSIVSMVTGIVEASLDLFPLILVLMLFLPLPFFVFLFWGSSLSLRGMRPLYSDRPRVHVPVLAICFIERLS